MISARERYYQWTREEHPIDNGPRKMNDDNDLGKETNEGDTLTVCDLVSWF